MAHWPRDRVDVVALSPQAVHKRLRDGSPTFNEAVSQYRSDN